MEIIPANKRCKPCAIIFRGNNPEKLWHNKEWLEVQYFKNNLTFKQIGKLVNRTDKTIQHFFNKFSLKARPAAHGLKGSNSYKWIGGRVKDARGYIKIFHPEQHSYKGKKQLYVLEHILVMEKILGRYLKHPEKIHHKNGIPSDNRPENLKLMANAFEHNTYEQLLGKFAKQILFGDLSPKFKQELQTIFQDFLSSFVKER